MLAPQRALSKSQMSVADTEILKEFLVESYENLDVLDREFVALERDPADHERIAGVFRTIHTIKGTAGFLGLPLLEGLTHAGENVLSLLRDSNIALTPETTSALLAMVDGVRAILKCIETNGHEGTLDYTPVIEILKGIGTVALAPPAREAPYPRSAHVVVKSTVYQANA